jgi:hypothetical protein
MNNPTPRHNESNLEVLLQGVLLPHECPHEHDRDRLAALDQDLYGEDDVPQGPHAEECAPHASESQDRELCGWDLRTGVPAGGGRDCVQEGRDEEED